MAKPLRSPIPGLPLLPASLLLALFLLLSPYSSPFLPPAPLLAAAQPTAAAAAAATASATGREVGRAQESGFCDRFITTSDGYILSIQRISNTSVTAPPITMLAASTSAVSAATAPLTTTTPTPAPTNAVSAAGAAAVAAAEAAARTVSAATAGLFAPSATTGTTTRTTTPAAAAATTWPAGPATATTAAAASTAVPELPSLPSLPSGRPMLRPQQQQQQQQQLQRQELPTTTTTLPSSQPLSQPIAQPLAQPRSTSQPQTLAQTQTQARVLPRYPVLLSHAMFMSSDLWFAFSNQSGSDPLIHKRVPVGLCNRGFDVFLLNHRSTEFSPGHVAYNTRQWLATIDIPSAIELVLGVTGAPKVHLLGFNEGGMLPFALGSTSPRYLERVTASVSSVAPTVFFQNVKSRVLRQWALGPSPDATVYQAHLLYGAYNHGSSTELLSGILEAVGYNMLTYFVTTGDPQDLLTNITGNPCCTDPMEPPAAPTPGWIATSYRNLIHYQQREWDTHGRERQGTGGHGREGEGRVLEFGTAICRTLPFSCHWLIRPSSPTCACVYDCMPVHMSGACVHGFSDPQRSLPAVGCTQCTSQHGPLRRCFSPHGVPILIMSGGNDWFGDPPNIQKLLSQLTPSSTTSAGSAGAAGPTVTHLELPRYSHLDLLSSETAVQDVHVPLIEYLETGHLGG
ncbi:unnamed protein product [Closterium sp. Naga37s-1]|nr:unnamed protein product [Closterium sp. Naga37s-1]